VVGVRFVAASPSLLAKCRATARAVGYPVPCPTRVPDGLVRTVPAGAIACLDVIGPGGVGGCARSWRRWVVGSSETETQHLVITASPRLLTNNAKLVNGPAWYPTARVRALGRVRVKRWLIQSVYVPPATNEGSAFMHHVVLIWSVGGHTYGIGSTTSKGSTERCFWMTRWPNTSSSSAPDAAQAEGSGLGQCSRMSPEPSHARAPSIAARA
jgi:hypothetical protein